MSRPLEAHPVQHRDVRDPLTLCHRIGGRWVRSASDEVRHLVNPATEEVIAVYPAGCAADVDTAVAAARAAQLDWRMTPLGDRLRLTGVGEGPVVQSDVHAVTPFVSCPLVDATASSSL